MPGDSIKINNKATAQNTYDAIVIGSGISGGWAAKELSEKGLKTLVLERGRDVKHNVDYPTTNMKPWEFPHRGEIPEEIQRIDPLGDVKENPRIGENAGDSKGEPFVYPAGDCP